MPRLVTVDACQPFDRCWKWATIAYHAKVGDRHVYRVAIGETSEDYTDNRDRVLAFAVAERKAFLDAGGRIGDI